MTAYKVKTEQPLETVKQTIFDKLGIVENNPNFTTVYESVEHGITIDSVYSLSELESKLPYNLLPISL